MRKLFITFFMFLAANMAVVAGVHRVGCYNIRYPAEADTAEKAWSTRRPYVVKMLKDTMNYDVVGLQEVYNSSYMDYLKDKMPAYTFHMGSTYGVAVAYRTSKYKCLDKGYFKLVPSPKPSGWEALQTRWAVWVKLQDKTSGEILVFTSTHLDLYPISIREGARICAEQMRQIAGNDACIITGDMNCEPLDRDPHANFTQYFGDAREMCKTTPKGSYNTFASGMNPSAASKRIDFIYARNVEVESYWTNPSTLGRTLMPSDHIPTMCEITILPKLRATTHVVNNVEELRQAARQVQVDDVIHLNAGHYDLGDSTLYVTNTCVIEGEENVILTGATQLFGSKLFISLELRDLHFQDASCAKGGYGSLVYMTGTYLKLSDCVMEGCQTDGSGLIYATNCALTVDRCVFRNNTSTYNSCGLIHTDDLNYQSGYSFPLTLTNSTFANNTAFRAPAVHYQSSSTAYMANNSFVGNQANERGCILIDAQTNTQDIRLVNNTFANNRIHASAGRGDAIVGGSSLWQNMAATGCLTMVHNTFVGNYTASWTTLGEPSDKFQSGTIHSASGKMKLYNNIIAGNFSSCPGRGDVSLTDPTTAAGGNNVFSSADHTNYALSSTDWAASSYAASLQELTGLYGGQVEDSVYHAPVMGYGANQMLTLSPLTARYARKNLADLDDNARSAAAMGSDILNVGSKTGILTTDQIGTTRNAKSVPGSMEVGQVPSSLPTTHYPLPSTHYTKILINHQLYIYHDEKLYTPAGMPVR